MTFWGCLATSGVHKDSTTRTSRKWEWILSVCIEKTKRRKFNTSFEWWGAFVSWWSLSMSTQCHDSPLSPRAGSTTTIATQECRRWYTISDSMVIWYYGEEEAWKLIEECLDDSNGTKILEKNPQTNSMYVSIHVCSSSGKYERVGFGGLSCSSYNPVTFESR